MPETRRVFVHCVSGLASHAAGSPLPDRPWYAERALLLAAPGDFVCVPCPIDPKHLAFLNALGVGPSPDGVLELGDERDSPASPPLAARLRDHERLLGRIAASVLPGDSLELHPYAVTAEIHALAGALQAAAGAPVRVQGGDPAAVHRADHKHLVRAAALRLGVPVAAGEIVELPFIGARRRGDLEPLRAAIARQLRWTGQVVVRGSAGAAGSSTYIVGRGREDADEVLRRLAERADNRIYLVEAMVDLTVSPNLHCRIAADGGVTCLGATDQRWSRPLAHAGNAYPSAARTIGEMEQWARVLCGWLAAAGYAGDVGFDFVEYRDPASGTPRCFLAEVNPRVNGANYPLALREGLNRARGAAGRPPLEAFASGMLTTGAEGFDDLGEALGELLFSHERGTGIVPYGLGCLTNGRCGAVALAASRQEALELFAEAQVALEAAWAMP